MGSVAFSSPENKARIERRGESVFVLYKYFSFFSLLVSDSFPLFISTLNSERCLPLDFIDHLPDRRWKNTPLIGGSHNNYSIITSTPTTIFPTLPARQKHQQEMCGLHIHLPGLSEDSKKKLKAAFTEPKAANGFILREPSKTSPDTRNRRGSTKTTRQAEWKADIERLDHEAKIAEMEEMQRMREGTGSLSTERTFGTREGDGKAMS